MQARRTVLASATVLVMAAPLVAAANQAASASSRPASSRPAERAMEPGLGRLQADAVAGLRVHRSEDGTVDHVSSTNGRRMVRTPGTKGPAGSAADQLARYGQAFGIDGRESRAVVSETIPSSTGGTVVRADQVVDGVPVFGGQVVLSLDENQDVVSIESATTRETEVPAPVVSQAQAQRTALLVTAKHHRVPAADLSVTAVGQRLYDPAILHTFDPRGARPVWQFEVGNGHDLRETVLIGTGRGEIALRFDDAPSINRLVCDNADSRRVSEDEDVPLCTSAARAEGEPDTSQPEVDAAYDNLGAAAETYTDVAGIDLTEEVGIGTPKKLMATVRWCFTEDPCPMDNAFWDGSQMVFGTGYARADDVVGHELTHGYVERTSGLFPIHQSGAINESVSDVVGEVIDHRNTISPIEDNTAWTVGEDLPGGALRSLKDPLLSDQPDRMTSARYATADAYDDAGGVHVNAGVGNKAAYLISQGGSFNGQTITGIDVAGTGLAKTGRLFLETIPRLTSGAEYADLGVVLASTCDQLAASATGGFTAANCASVRKAVLATELATAPADPNAAAPETASSCPAGGAQPILQRREDDGVSTFGEVSFGELWQRTPAGGTPSWSKTGVSSWFGWNPDPSLDHPRQGGPAVSTATLGPFYLDGAEQALLSFHHAYLFEWADAEGGSPAEYYDGGQVVVQTMTPDLDWKTETSLPWVNGPNRTIAGSSTKGFGGDSHGYGSSAVDLSSLVGKTVRVQFTIRGDEYGSELGWFVDDIQLNRCTSRVPNGPLITSVNTIDNSVRLGWKPDYVGSGVASYRISMAGGKVLRTVPGTARSVTITGLNSRLRHRLELRAVNAYGESEPGATVWIYPTGTRVTSSVFKAKKNKPFKVTAWVTYGNNNLKGMPVVLQSRLARSSVWRNVSSGYLSAAGEKAWSVRLKKSTYYRVIARGKADLFGSVSAPRLVKKR